MTNLQLVLDDIDFERLLELGRSVIPTIAPAWTDHNTHDPGIMLTELVAWIADAQVSRRLPDKLVVHIIERQPAAVWRF